MTTNHNQYNNPSTLTADDLSRCLGSANVIVTVIGTDGQIESTDATEEAVEVAARAAYDAIAHLARLSNCSLIDAAEAMFVQIESGAW